MATRALVSKLSLKFPVGKLLVIGLLFNCLLPAPHSSIFSLLLQAMQVVGVCDYNPHGLALLLTYRFTSTASNFESRGLQAEVRYNGMCMLCVGD